MSDKDKLVRVKPDKHIKLKKRANKNKRTVPTELDLILEKELINEQGR